MNKTFQDFQAAGKQNMETCANSATILTQGLQEIATNSAEFANKSFEKNTAAVETMMAAKTFENVVEAQQTIAKSAYEDFISQMTKVGEMYTASATQAFKPVQDQMNKFSAAPAKKAASK